MLLVNTKEKTFSKNLHGNSVKFPANVIEINGGFRVGAGGPTLFFCPGIFFFRKRVSDSASS